MRECGDRGIYGGLIFGMLIRLHICGAHIRGGLIYRGRINGVLRFYGLLPRDNNWSINRVYINEKNNYLSYKSKLNVINFSNHTDWILQDGSLKQNLFYAHKLHLSEEGNAKLVVSICNCISLNASIDKSVSIFSKLFPCHTGLKREDFPMLSCSMSFRNSVCNPDKPIAKYVRKYF